MSHSILKIFRYVKYLLFSQLWYYKTLNHMYIKEAVVKINLKKSYWKHWFLGSGLPRVSCGLFLLLCCVCWLSLCDHTLQSFGGFSCLLYSAFLSSPSYKKQKLLWLYSISSLCCTARAAAGPGNIFNHYIFPFQIFGVLLHRFTFVSD